MDPENASDRTRRQPFAPRGPRPLAQRAHGVAAEIFAARGFSNPQIVLRWREFAGPTLGRITAPVSLSREGVLTISADASATLFLQHQTAQILQRLNMALGGAAVQRIKVVAGKFPPPPRPPALPQAEDRAWSAQRAAIVQDDALRAALEALGASVSLAQRTRRRTP